MFAARVATSGECAHKTFPEVVTSEWLPDVIGEGLAILGEAVQRDGMDLETLSHMAEHVLIVIAGAGYAAGMASAAEGISSLSDIAWDSLPDVFGGE